MRQVVVHPEGIQGHAFPAAFEVLPGAGRLLRASGRNGWRVLWGAGEKQVDDEPSAEILRDGA